MIQELVWDSIFFKKKIAKIEIKKNSDKFLLRQISSDYDLIYVFSNLQLEVLKNYYIDTKIIFSKSISEPLNSPTNFTISIKSPKKINGFQNKNLYELAYISGHKSRFNLDSKFSDDEFKLLYRKWIDNSVQDSKTIVRIALNKTSIVGFITCKLKGNSSADITLIAVDSKFHGLGLGKLLTSNVEHCLIEKNITKLYVDTQSSNLQAIKFYSQIGFHLFSKTEIYHVWK